MMNIKDSMLINGLKDRNGEKRTITIKSINMKKKTHHGKISDCSGYSQKYNSNA